MAGKRGKFSDSSGDWKTEPSNLPHTIYFYYFHADGTIRAYLWANPVGDPIPLGTQPGSPLNKLIFQLAENAQKAKPDSPRPIGWTFGDVPWFRKAHIVVVLENDEFEQWVVDIKRLKDGAEVENHCFFDGGFGELSDGSGKTVQAMWTVNYMKNLSGEDIPEFTGHKFKWKFKTRGRRRFEDGNGTNMGPPLPPPS